jgi:hypothetical protein
MEYKVLEIWHSKRKKRGRKNINLAHKKAKHFDQVTTLHTQIYEKEIEKKIANLKQRIEKEKNRKKYWDRTIQRWRIDFREESEQSKVKNEN